MFTKNKPVFDSDYSECLKARLYIIEFLDELCRMNQMKTTKSDYYLNQEIQQVNERKPILINVEIISDDSDTSVDNSSMNNFINLEPEIIKIQNKKPEIRHKKRNEHSMMRFIPRHKLNMFEDITLRKIENEYKNDENSLKHKRRSFLSENTNSNNFKHASEKDRNKRIKSKKVDQLEEIESINTKQYSFYDEFCNYLQFNDPYYKSSIYANRNINHYTC